jgi:phage protein D
MLGFGGFDNKSFYSQKVQTINLSVRPQSSNLNTTMEQMRNTTTTNSGMYPYYNTLRGGGSSS